MSVFISVGIVILAMLIMVSLQLVPGVFALFYHYALGKYSKKQASTLAIFFIIGTEIIAAFLFITSIYIADILFLNDLDPRNNVLTWIFAGILIALSFASFFLYYRHPHAKDSELFIPRKFAKALNLRAKRVKTPSDAFALGAFSNVPELLFTLPLYIITATEIIYSHTEYFADDLLTIIYILVPTIPLFILYYTFHFNHNLAHVIKTRIHDKSFHRLCLGFSYLTIAILIICFRIV